MSKTSFEKNSAKCDVLHLGTDNPNNICLIENSNPCNRTYQRPLANC